MEGVAALWGGAAARTARKEAVGSLILAHGVALVCGVGAGVLVGALARRQDHVLGLGLHHDAQHDEEESGDQGKYGAANGACRVVRVRAGGRMGGHGVPTAGPIWLAAAVRHAQALLRTQGIHPNDTMAQLCDAGVERGWALCFG